MNEEETEPENPGVGAVEEYEAGEDGEVQPIQAEATAELPPAQPEEDSNTGGRYNLHSDRNLNYNHHYTGEDFVVDSESGIVMATEGTGEVLETPQMRYLGSRNYEFVLSRNYLVLYSGGFGYS